jgi:hypothetical protein
MSHGEDVVLPDPTRSGEIMVHFRKRQNASLHDVHQESNETVDKDIYSY